MGDIEQLAFDLLSHDELKLVGRLLVLDSNGNAGPLIENILPIYWVKVDDICENHEPTNIYRPLYYVHKYSREGGFKNNTRTLMNSTSNHIEGCLQYLLGLPAQSRSMSGAFGPAVAKLKEQRVLSSVLANSLKRFNDVINVPAKHFGAYAPTRRLDERTFSDKETVCAIIIMRNLSVQLFALLKTHHVSLPEDWPQFDTNWFL